MPKAPLKPSESTRALGVGMTFAASVALFSVGGLWLDEKLSTSPWLLLLGIFMGLFGGTIHMLHHLAPGTLPFGPKTPPKTPPKDSPTDSQ